MAVAFVANHTAGVDKTAGTSTVAATLAANVAAGNLLVALVVYDNQSSTTPTVASLSKPGGESASWVKLEGAGASSATALASVLGELWAIKTTVQWNSGTAVTATASGNTTGKVMLLSEFSGADVTEVSTSGTASSATNDASAVTTGTAPVSGCLVIGGSGSENSIESTGDVDTTNGSWSTIYAAHTSGSTNISNVSAGMQYKIPTGSGHQTYNPALPVNDSIAMVAALQATVTVTPISGTDTGSGADTGTLAASPTGADTGAGVDAATLARSSTVTDTGAGADTGAYAAAQTAADTATGTDTAGAATSSGGTDTGTGADTGALAAALTAADTGTATDTAVVSTSVDVAGADTGTGVDTATVVQLEAVTGADTGTATDAATVTALEAVTASDTATATDTAFVTVMLAATDTASAAELAALAVQVAAADLAAALDHAIVTTPAGMPPLRTTTVPPENRVTMVPPESRVTDVPPENRTTRV